MESSTLSEAKLKYFAKKFSKTRKWLREQALKVAKEDKEDPSKLGAKDFERLAKRMHKGYFRERK